MNLNIVDDQGFVAEYIQRFAADPTDHEKYLCYLQRMAELPETGKADFRTIRFMRRTPRCGVRDTPMAQGVLQQWGINKLTFFIEKYVEGISQEDQAVIFEQAFQSWEQHTDLVVTRTNQPSANLIISVGRGATYNFDGAGGVLAWAQLPPGRNFQGQLWTRFDLDETWLSMSSNQRGIYLLNVAAHEFGHLLGLGHSSERSALMAPFYNRSISDPQQNDDIPRIQSLFGKDPDDPDDPDPPPPPMPPDCIRLRKFLRDGIRMIDEFEKTGKIQ